MPDAGSVFRITWEHVVRAALELEPLAREQRVPPWQVERLIHLVLEFNAGLTGSQRVNVSRGEDVAE